MKKKKIYLQQKKRYMKKIFGTNSKPRLTVFRSHNHIYAQLIDDENGYTLAASSTRNKMIKSQLTSLSPQEASFKIGQDLALKAKNNNTRSVVFDRGFFIYAGRIQKIAEGARDGGLNF